MKNKPNFFFDNRGFPNWGEGGPPIGNFPHIIPFFSDNVPKLSRAINYICVHLVLFDKSHTNNFILVLIFNFTWFSLTTGSAGALNPFPGRKGRAIFFITNNFHDQEPFSFSLIWQFHHFEQLLSPS